MSIFLLTLYSILTRVFIGSWWEGAGIIGCHSTLSRDL